MLQTINAEDLLMQSQDNTGNLTQTEQQSNQNQTSNTMTGTGYTGSSFACMLVLILFIIWALYRVGCLGNKR